jgi:hypothetical protein
MSRWTVLAVLLPVALPFGTIANGQTRDDLVTAARAFDEGALRRDDDNAKPISVRKWAGPIRLAFRNPGSAPGLVEPTRRAIRAIAAETGSIAVVDVESADATANYTVRFDENESVQGKTNCYATAWWKAWTIDRADLKVNPAQSSTIDVCLIHEALHSYGLLSHPHGADSVLSYVYKRRALTPVDVHLIHTLYDTRMTVGLQPAPASQLACRILGERMGSSAADIAAVCTDRKGPVPNL